MPAYLIANVKVSDPEQYKQYMALSPGAIAAAGGKFLVRGGQSQVLEGPWQPDRLVILEFPDWATAQKFYDSPLYREARAKRAGATETFNAVIVEGLPA